MPYFMMKHTMWRGRMVRCGVLNVLIVSWIGFLLSRSSYST